MSAVNCFNRPSAKEKFAKLEGKSKSYLAHEYLTRTGIPQKLIKEGKVIESPEENLKELEQQAKEFKEKRLSILKILQIT